MKTTYPETEGFIDGGPSSGTADRPLPPHPNMAGASHPDEPQPLFGEPERDPPGTGYEPKDVMFADQPPSTKARTVPNDPSSPKPLFADEPSGPAVDRAPAPTRSGPGALRFVDGPSTVNAPNPARAPVAPSRPSSSPSVGGLSFKDMPPAPTSPVQPGSSGHALFQATESPLIRRGIEIAKDRYPALWAEDGGETFQRHLRQLLPLDRASIEAWGGVVLDRVAEMATTTASVTRTYLDLGANELLAQALQDARAPAPKVWQRLVKPPVSLDQCRLRLKNLREATAPLIAKVDQHHKDAQDATQRLARALASLSVVTTVSSSLANNGVARTLDDRSSLLASSLRQAELLGPQLKNLGDQMRDLNNQVDEALSVTFPALALARAARG